MSASRRTSPAREVEVVADQLHTAALHLSRRLRAEDAALGISSPRLSALAAVVAGDPVAIGTLAAAEGVAAPTMSRLVDGLQRDGLVRRDPDPTDARGVLVVATPKGKRLLASARRDRVRALAEGLGDLTGAELADVSRGAGLIERISRGT